MQFGKFISLILSPANKVGTGRPGWKPVNSERNHLAFYKQNMILLHIIWASSRENLFSGLATW